MLDSGGPAGEASGRNGGNFELIPENSVGVYEGLARERRAFLGRRYPRLPREVRDAESERQASLVLGVALRNREALKGIILREGIAFLGRFIPGDGTCHPFRYVCGCWSARSMPASSCTRACTCARS